MADSKVGERGDKSFYNIDPSVELPSTSCEGGSIEGGCGEIDGLIA